MDLQLKDGWIEVISGNMYAGKTEELLRRVRRIEYAKKSVIVFKPTIDNRYSQNEVVSHNNDRIKSINIRTPKDILNHVDPLPYAVAIDALCCRIRTRIIIIDSVNRLGKQDNICFHLNGSEHYTCIR